MWGSASEPTLITLGDIGCSEHYVHTPNGSFPLAGSSWIVTDNTSTQTKIPAYAIVLAIVFFVFCLLGLLFLLMKEQVTTGYVVVSVQGPGLYHTMQIPYQGPYTLADVNDRVNYIRQLVANLPPPT
jgi:hypothetical protein